MESSLLKSCSTLLKPFSGNENIIIRGVDGSKTFGDVSEVFESIIDREEEDGECSLPFTPDLPTGETSVEIFKAEGDMRFTVMFEAASCFRVVQAPGSDVKIRIIPADVNPDVDKLSLTQHQILEFLINHRRWLSDSCSTLFLLKPDHLRVARISTTGSGKFVMFLERFDNALNAGEARLVVPSITEPDFELDYLEDAPPVRFVTEYGELCITGPIEQEQSIRGSLERYQRDDPAHKYLLVPIHAERILTFSARTNIVIKWKKDKGFSVWKTSW